MKDIGIWSFVLMLMLTGNFTLAGETSGGYARVVSVVEIKERRQMPREECRDVVVEEGKPVKDDKRILGTVGGAVVGGVLGHQVGGGRGKDLATAAGAVAGALGGRKVQENRQQKNAQPKVEKRCETVTEMSETVVGYDVTYELDGKQHTVRMSKKPGNRIPLKNGKPVLD
jgi:uncharacterized protein YcfJ